MDTTIGQGLKRFPGQIAGIQGVAVEDDEVWALRHASTVQRFRPEVKPATDGEMGERRGSAFPQSRDRRSLRVAIASGSRVFLGNVDKRAGVGTR